MRNVFYPTVVLLALAALSGCRSVPTGPGPRTAGDEIIVAGKRFYAGTRIVTWKDVGGYNGYAKPVKTGVKAPVNTSFTPRTFSAAAAKKGNQLAALQATVDQFVLHYDVCGLSKICFNVLQQRNLSSHFLLDIDGTIYQTIDLKERALHATVSNNRSIGIEIANVGAYPFDDIKAINDWYRRDQDNNPYIQVPARIADPGIFLKPFTGRPARSMIIKGRIHDTPLQQCDYTPEQYAALAKLIAALHRVFPLMKIDYPQDAQGRLITRKLPDKDLEKYQGVLGHFHIQENKSDPGPALQWDYLIKSARAERR